MCCEDVHTRRSEPANAQASRGKYLEGEQERDFEADRALRGEGLGGSAEVVDDEVTGRETNPECFAAIRGEMMTWRSECNRSATLKRDVECGRCNLSAHALLVIALRETVISESTGPLSRYGMV